VRWGGGGESGSPAERKEGVRLKIGFGEQRKKAAFDRAGTSQFKVRVH
jgi:hypothetical protein